MKKTSIKVFGVCAATLLTMGAVAPVAVHAEEADVSIEARDTNSTQTPNNLKTDATVNIARLNEFIKFINENTVNTAYVASWTTNNNQEQGIALKEIKEGIFKDLFFDNTSGVVAGNLGLNLYNPNGLTESNVINQLFGDYTLKGLDSNNLAKDKDGNPLLSLTFGEDSENQSEVREALRIFYQGDVLPESAIEARVTNPDGKDVPVRIETGESSLEGYTYISLLTDNRKRTDEPKSIIEKGATIEIKFFGNEALKFKVEKDIVFNTGTAPQQLTANEGLKIEKSLPETYELGKNRIYMTSDFGTDGNIYKAGDKVNLKFWTNYDAGNSNKLEQIASTTVTFTGQNEAGDFTTIANTLNGVVGQEYLPFQNVTVRNNNTNTTLNPVVITEEDGNVFYLAKNGAFELLPGVTNVTDLEDKLQNYGVNDNQVKPIYNAIYQEFGYEVGNFYFLEDQSNFIEGNRVREEQDIVNGVNRGTKFIFNSVVSDYNQRLHVIVPYFTNSDTKIPNIESNYASRMINVTENGETPVDPEETKVPVYRAYNPNNGDHLFTTSLKEYNEVVDKGWAPEGLAWNAASKEDGTKPVYRLYNPNSGEHFYTDSEKEYNEVAAAGWNKEGIAFYSAASEDGVKIFRSFNPNATGPGSHMFTDSEKEYNELTAAGWSPEGVAFYGIK